MYAKKPFAGPTVLLKYLTRYTHRVALDNRRLVKLSDDEVTLSYKDYAAGCARKEMTLPAVELLRRFALHILPHRFVRIRHYGLLTNRDRDQRLAKCRALLAQRTSASAAGSAEPVAMAGMVPAAPSATALAPMSAMPAMCALAVPLAAAVSAASLAPILLLAALASPAAAKPAPAATRAPAEVIAVATMPAGLCRVCGQGRPQTFWQAARPLGYEFELAWSWDTS